MGDKARPPVDGARDRDRDRDNAASLCALAEEGSAAALHALAMRRPADPALAERVTACARRLVLTHSDSTVKAAALQYLSREAPLSLLQHLGGPTTTTSTSSASTASASTTAIANGTATATATTTAAAATGSAGTAHELCVSLGRDNDSRVRAESLRSMATLHHRGLPLQPAHLAHAHAMLQDDAEAVRTAALHVVWLLGRTYPNETVPAPDGSGPATLVDVAFVSLCNMLNDGEWRVRAEACQLLGSLQGVSLVYLMQTFDKKIISHLQRKQSAHEQLRAKHKRAVEIKPEGDEDVRDMTLASSGACGAFVHGLEDEFFEVRKAAIDSICELGMRSEEMASSAVDFLVDMFNDEIDLVRIDAVGSLRKLSPFLVFREEHLDVMLGILDDASSAIRSGVHLLFGGCRLANYTCLQAVVFALVQNLNRYPQDRLSIWRCMMNMGRNHASFAEFLIEGLLRIDVHFAQVEPSVDDVVYVAVIALVAGAASCKPSLLSLAPAHTLRHIKVLHDKHPDYILLPPLTAGADLAKRRKPLSADEDGEDNVLMRNTRAETETCIALLAKGEFAQAEDSLRLCMQNLKQLATFATPTQAGNIHFQRLITLWLMKYAKAAEQRFSASEAGRIGAQLGALAYKLETAFHGLDDATRASLYTLRTIASLLHTHGTLAVAHRVGAGGKGQTFYPPALLIESLMQRCRSSRSSTSKNLRDLCTDLEELVSQPSPSHERVLQSIARCLQKLHPPPGLWPQGLLKMSSAIISGPASTTLRPLTFTAGLPLTLEVEATLSNVVFPDRLVVEALLPNSRRIAVQPAPSELVPTGPHSYALTCPLLLTQPTWSDDSVVEVRIGLRVASDIAGESDALLEGETIVAISSGFPVYILPRSHTFRNVSVK
eukprot:m.97070 g.97070  ORF g.97070 m.97070 type:complete len:889 (-) comp15509_c0_seq2:164-2830(-)